MQSRLGRFRRTNASSAATDVAPGRSSLLRLMLARLVPVAAMAGLALAVFLPILAGAGGRAQDQDQAQDQAPESAIADLIGEYTVGIGREDVPPGLPGGPVLIGLWTVTFNADGSYVVARQDVGQVASGTFEVAGATLELTDWTGIIACSTPADVDTAASYAWARAEDGLTLTPITEACTARDILFSTRAFGSFLACAVPPLFGPLVAPSTGVGTPMPMPVASPQGTPPATPVAATPSAQPGATPLAQIPGVAVQEGLPQGATPEEAIDALLAQATGCWATQDPARFLPLHSQKVFDELAAIGPLPDVARELQGFMSIPVTFERIGGDFNQIDETHVWAYVELAIAGEQPFPQRIDFVFEDGTWLFDTFFLGPSAPPPGEGEPTPGLDDQTPAAAETPSGEEAPATDETPTPTPTSDDG